MSTRESTIQRTVGPAVGAALLAVALLGASFIDPLAPILFAAVAAVALLLVAAVERPEIALFLLLAAAAMDISGRIAEVGSAKITVYQAFALFVFALMIWRLRTAKSTLHPTAIDAPAVIYLGLVFISLLVAEDRLGGFVDAVSFSSSVMFAYAVVVLADTRDRLRFVVLGTLAVAAALGVLAVLERFRIFTVGSYLEMWGQGIRAKVTFKDPNILGSFMMTSIAMALPLALGLKNGWLKAASMSALLLAALGLATTGSRGALVGMVISLVVVLVLLRIKPSSKLALLLAAVLLVAGVVIYVADPGWLQARVINVSEDNSFAARFYMGSSAVNMALDNPMGIGMGNYANLYPYYRDVNIRANLVESHTAYLTILVEIGVLGLLAFLWLLWRYAAATFRAARSADDFEVHAIAVGSLAAVLGISAQAFTYSLEVSKFWWLAIGVGLAAASLVATASASMSLVTNGEKDE
jgi:O-antigen ligase